MASGMKELPYGAEYAKSGRAACKGCDGYISQDSLRMSLRKPSRFFDGLQDNWFHFGCFWKKINQGDINEASIRGMELLKWDDQERIRRKILENQAGVCCSQKQPSVPFVEYAPTGRSKCVFCKENIKKDALRLGTKSAWHHVTCFEKAQQYSGGCENVIGFQDLLDSDQEILKTMFDKYAEKRVKNENEEVAEIAAKKAKIEQSRKEQLKAQADEMWSVRELLSNCLDKRDMQTLLIANKQPLPAHGGESKLLDRLVDCMVFGCPLPCEQCKGGRIVYNSSKRTYTCNGYISEYTHCTYTCNNPPRTKFVIPDEIRKNIAELEHFEEKEPKEREYSTSKEVEEVIVPKSFKAPVRNAFGKNNDSINHMKSSCPDSLDKKQRQLVKSGAVVDPECEYQEVVHVWRDEYGKLWDTTLGKADFQTGQNSFYKLQLLKHDVKASYYLFRSWGRVGTEIGGTKTDKYHGDLEEAKLAFERLFKEKTANEWKDSANFKKVPGKMSVIETDYEDASKKIQEFVVKPGSLTKLPVPIQEIVGMIFDVDSMIDILQDLEIDTDKMPLGKLSKRHIQSAYGVLTELQKLIEAGNAKYDDFLDATNRFFTLIPHNFGMKKPPLLDSQLLLSDKTKMLDDLLDLEIAYSILKTDNEADRKRDPVDVHYEKLHAHLEVMDKDSEEYKRILQYATNTHAPTHNTYKIEIVDIIRVRREGEDERFKKDIPNHYLLWHGSRTTNYAGILSQGLRIAPPEAPVTGYMFGKGIYFADMMSKSANYCFAINKEGFILLCEVALGEIQEEIEAKSITKLKKGKHSVKGMGQIIPDPNGYFVTDDGVTIPMGKPFDTKKQNLALLYNEYIVYNVAQVRIRYLVRAKFISEFF